MQGDRLSRRVTLLEQRMERFEEVLRSEIRSLRADMAAGFADMHGRFALRTDMAAGFADMHGRFALRTDMEAGFADMHARFALRTDMEAGFADMHGRFALRTDMEAGFADMHARFALRTDMEAGFDAIHRVLISLQTQITDNHRQMLVLHEDVIARLATLGEQIDRSRSRRRRKP
jgi:hypothetical protein